MLINNPFKLNDWKYGQFIKTIVIIQLLMLFFTFLNFKNIQIPIITPLIGFIYLTFIPGMIILRILNLHDLGTLKSVLYGVGLSISSIMFIGYFLDICLPFFGVAKPISVVPVTVGFTIYVTVLSILSLRDRNFSCPSFIDTGELFSPVFLFLCLIPFVAIFGSYTMNLYASNLVSMFLIILIALTLFLVVFNMIDEKWHLFTVWIIAISLLYFSSLISSFVWGWDVQNEYYLANVVLNYSYWNFNLPDAYNAMLSIVMVAPVYSIITGIDLDHVFKIVYPFLFSLLPVGLYKIFRSQTDNSKIAFLAVFLFMSFNTFYIELVTLSREMTGELFLVILIMLILERKYKANNLILMGIFSMALVVSHYSLTYFFIIAILGVTLLMAFYNYSKFGLSREFLGLDSHNNNLVVFIFISLFIMSFAYLWYGSYANGLALKSITDVLGVVTLNLTQIMNTYIVKLGLTPGLIIYAAIVFLIFLVLLLVFYLLTRLERGLERVGVDSMVHKVPIKTEYRVITLISLIAFVALIFTTGPYKTWIVTVLRYMNFVAVFFVIAGILSIFLHMYRNKFQQNYLAFSVVAALMLIMGFVLPSFQSAFNITRIYEITFLILSPFCVYGGMKILGSIYMSLRGSDMDVNTPVRIFSLFLLVFMLFNTGFVSVLASQSIPMQLSNENIASDYYPLFNIPEVVSAQWLSDNRVSSNIYADVYGRFIFNRYIYSLNEPAISNGVTDFTSYGSNNSYIYQRKLDINNKYLTGFTGFSDRNRVYLDLSVIVIPKNKIFDDGDSKVYYS